jgi:SAM-dependent methyltransferase
VGTRRAARNEDGSVAHGAASGDDSQLVRTFYEHEGWQWTDGVSGDATRWRALDPGPLQRRLSGRRIARMRELLGVGSPDTDASRLGDSSHGGSSGAPGPMALELGSGGQPAVPVMEGVGSYTAADFSRRGLDAARGASAALGVPTGFVEADARLLPFGDGRFDVLYSAHMLYHLPTRADQEQALGEMVRVLAPGGALAVVTANPYPWLFPLRCLRRAVADTPGLGALANRLRRTPPLPYLPRPPRWIRAVLGRDGNASVHPYAVPTTWFSRSVRESTTLGRFSWRVVTWLETRMPGLARSGGAFTLVVLRKARLEA